MEQCLGSLQFSRQWLGSSLVPYFGTSSHYAPFWHHAKAARMRKLATLTRVLREGCRVKRTLSTTNYTVNNNSFFRSSSKIVASYHIPTPTITIQISRQHARLPVTADHFHNRHQKMGKTKRKFYAVGVGRRTGVFDSWDECEPQVRVQKTRRARVARKFYRRSPCTHAPQNFRVQLNNFTPK